MHKIVFVNLKKKRIKTDKFLKRKQKSNDLINDFINKKRKNHKSKVLNYKYIVPILIMITGIIYSVNIDNKFDYLEKATLIISKSLDDEEYAITEYSQVKENENINVYYPITKYGNFNNYLIEKLEEKINSYRNETFYDIKGNFEYYKSNNIISVLINLDIDLKGTHLVQDKLTLNYNYITDEFVTIESKINELNNFLAILSEFTYNDLMKNSELNSDEKYEYMVKQGTSENIENFRNIIYSDKHLIVIFKPYQVAPYYLGEFKVNIPYSEFE